MLKDYTVNDAVLKMEASAVGCCGMFAFLLQNVFKSIHLNQFFFQSPLSFHVS